MSDYKYTVAEIDALRDAVRKKHGPSEYPMRVSGPTGDNFSKVDQFWHGWEARFEQYVRTYMQAGIRADEL